MLSSDRQKKGPLSLGNGSLPPPLLTVPLGSAVSKSAAKRVFVPGRLRGVAPRTAFVAEIVSLPDVRRTDNRRFGHPRAAVACHCEFNAIILI